VICAESQPANINSPLAASGGMSLFDMLKRYAFSFYEVIIRIERLRRTASVDSGKASTYRLDELSAALVQMRAECVKLDLAHTPDLISHIESEVHRKGNNYNCEDMVNHLETLASSFATELRKKVVFRITDDQKDYFERDDLFGSQVTTAFPSCVTEIKNAGNCYALQQDDACVFHCMRVLELALRVLAKELGVTFAGTLDLQNWQNIIENIENEIKNLEKLPKSKYKSETLKLFSQAAMQFRWFKEAWRNHVMHGRDVYDAGKAYSILGHVKELMQALAEGGLAE
jgi:hypothetical protein